MYTSALIPLKDYLKITNKNELRFDIVIPLVITCLLSYFVILKMEAKEMQDFAVLLINSFAILLGFGLTSLTVLTSSDSSNVKVLKEKKSSRILENEKITFYQLMLVLISYTIVVGATLLLLLIVIYASIGGLDVTGNYYNEQLNISRLSIGFILFLALNVIMVTIRIATNLYFTHWQTDGIGDSGDTVSEQDGE